jgi:anti-sigma factor RsiW
MSDQTEDDEIAATLSDYLDGVLSAEHKCDVEARLASDEVWKRTHAELLETRDALSGMQKARAPASFAQEVTATIHARSAGRFFARKTLGDKVPFGVLLVIALLGLGVIAYIMWSSSTGSLKVDDQRPSKPGSAVVDKP